MGPVARSHPRAHDLQAELGVPEERRYIHSWKYLILMSLAKLLLNVDQSQPWDERVMDSMSTLEDFVIDSYGSRDPISDSCSAPRGSSGSRARFG
jgi:hypothetical protein